MEIKTDDKIKIDKIIENLSERDKEKIYEETKSLVEDKRTNPVIAAIRNYMPVYTDADAILLAEDSCEYQEKTSAALWDLTALVVTYDYALALYMRMNYKEEPDDEYCHSLWDV